MKTRTPPNTHLVFVYGTLRRGGHNHRLLAQAIFHGTAKTTPTYDLIDLGPFPAMVAGGNTAVVGEVYEVDGEMLAALDRLEGHPHFYRRGWVRLEDGRNVESYLMERKKAKSHIVIQNAVDF